jgi:hypothetical protein
MTFKTSTAAADPGLISGGAEARARGCAQKQRLTWKLQSFEV